MNTKLKKALYESIMNAVAKTVKKLLNEGAGAGYNVYIEGILLDDFKISSRNSLDEYGNSVRQFTATVVPGVVTWSAEGYYDGVTSDGIYYNDILMEEYTDDDNTINGGIVKGYVDVSDVTDYDDEGYSSNFKDACNSYLRGFASDITISTMYGSGYSHVNLGTPEFTLKDIDIDGYNTAIHIDSITINAAGIADNVNWYFANVHNFDEIYGVENDMDE